MSTHEEHAAVVVGHAYPWRWLVIRHGDTPRVHILEGPKLRLGAAPDNDVILRGEGIAALHCTLRREGSKVRLYDRGSTRGTLLNGRPLLQPTTIGETARLLIGGHSLTVRPLQRRVDTGSLKRGYLPIDEVRQHTSFPPLAAQTKSPHRRGIHLRIAALFGLISCAAWLSYGLATNALAKQGPADPRPRSTQAVVSQVVHHQEPRPRPLPDTFEDTEVLPTQTHGRSLAHRLCRDPLQIPTGSRSVGSVTLGALDEPIQMPSLDLYDLRCSARAYSTEATANGLIQAIACFRAESQYSGEIVIGDISGRDGGPLGPHRSHQSGRDVDLWLPIAGGRYGRGCTHCDTDHCRPEPDEVDWTATWALVDTLAGVPEIETIFLDYTLQADLRRAALEAGANPARLDARIQWPRRGSPALVQHADGHVHHMHIRFRCPANDPSCTARPSTRRAYAEAEAEALSRSPKGTIGADSAP